MNALGAPATTFPFSVEVLPVLAGRLLDFVPKLASLSGCTGLSDGSGGPGLSASSAGYEFILVATGCLVIYYLSEEIHTLLLLSM